MQTQWSKLPQRNVSVLLKHSGRCLCRTSCCCACHREHMTFMYGIVSTAAAGKLVKASIEHNVGCRELVPCRGSLRGCEVSGEHLCRRQKHRPSRQARLEKPLNGVWGRAPTSVEVRAAVTEESPAHAKVVGGSQVERSGNEALGGAVCRYDHFAGGIGDK